MIYKWIGAVLVVAGCTGFGFSAAAAHRRQEQFLQQLIKALQMIRWELQYRLTPLPELCRMAARGCRNPLKEVLRKLAKELDNQTFPDADGCMAEALKKCGELPPGGRRLLRQLGGSLGRFDLPGQLEGLQSLTEECRQNLQELRSGADVRLRSYRTLGICAGISLAILFL